MREKNDYGVALLACALLDKVLHLAINHALPNRSVGEKLFEERAPLNSLNAKITMAHALGLYGSKTRRNLDALRNIRNFFAHQMSPLSFETAEIKEACMQLVELPIYPGLFMTPLSFNTPRDRYTSAAICISFTVFMNMFGILWEGESGESRPVALP